MLLHLFIYLTENPSISLHSYVQIHEGISIFSENKKQLFRQLLDFKTDDVYIFEYIFLNFQRTCGISYSAKALLF